MPRQMATTRYVRYSILIVSLAPLSYAINQLVSTGYNRRVRYC